MFFHSKQLRWVIQKKKSAILILGRQQVAIALLLIFQKNLPKFQQVFYINYLTIQHKKVSFLEI